MVEQAPYKRSMSWFDSYTRHHITFPYLTATPGACYTWCMGKVFDYVLEVSDCNLAAQFLGYAGFVTVDPHYQRESLHHRTRAKITKRLRLLPGYLFVVDLPDFGTADWRAVNSTPGVRGPISADGAPLSLSAGLARQVDFECRMGAYDQWLAAPPRIRSTILHSFRELQALVPRMFPSVRGPIAA